MTLNNAPVYAAAMYKDLAKVCHRHGYALAVHGSLAKDLDLIAVPWTEEVSPPDVVLAGITSEFAVRLVGGLTAKNHGRICQTIALPFGGCYLDFSFMPGVSQ